MQVIHLLSQDPYLNLAFEDYIFRHNPYLQPVLLLWQNRPSVIMGRGQNPWAEINLEYIDQHGIDLVRRQSGGGCVYHDTGNLNISFISDPKDHDRQANYQQVIAQLKQLGYTLTLNTRGDLTIRHQANNYKVSGSAYRMSATREFHHLSLLINTNLEHLHQSLTSPLQIRSDRSVPSQRSTVINLTEIKPISVMEVIKSFKMSLGQVDPPLVLKPETIAAIEHCQQVTRDYQRPEWLYHKTLPFEEQLPIRLNNNTYCIDIAVHKGKITTIQMNSSTCDPEMKQHISSLLISQPRQRLHHILATAPPMMAKL